MTVSFVIAMIIQQYASCAATSTIMSTSQTNYVLIALSGAQHEHVILDRRRILRTRKVGKRIRNTKRSHDTQIGRKMDIVKRDRKQKK